MPTPPAFPPGTPCYREEVSEQVYETATYTTIYELYFQASVCLFSNEIVLYGLDTSLSFPNDVQDPRLTSMQFVVRDQVVSYSPTEKDGYSRAVGDVLPRPGAAERLPAVPAPVGPHLQPRLGLPVLRVRAPELTVRAAFLP